ncbi:MAG: SAM-dependent methyltransferase [Clostridiales bacterium]|nr:MAG: SAM-dependent methyltransferase [Clostridiales bacterium]
MKDEEYVNTLISLIPNELKGKLLDIPAGTAIFTYGKYKQMPKANIFCLDYSQEMLDYAIKRFKSSNTTNVNCIQGDAGDIPFENNFFDIVLSMNGFHAFPEKQKAFNETNRVLKTEGKFIGCCYIKGERKLSDFFVRNIFVKNGTFSPPFMTKHELELQLKEKYKNVKIWNIKSIVCFECTKK